VAVLTAYFGWESAGKYGELAAEAYMADRNPLSIWERLCLMRFGLEGHGLLDRVTVLAAPRHDLDWGRVAEFYPPRRIICLTSKDKFEAAKGTLWEQRGERVHVFSELDEKNVLTTSRIRQLVAAGVDWRHFLPERSHSYFLEIGGPARVFGVIGP
jgi:hypothetical protein